MAMNRNIKRKIQPHLTDKEVDELVAQYLKNGGKITRCPDGPGLTRFKD